MCRIEIMDFLLTVLCFGIFVGLNAQPAGNLNFVCRDGEEFDTCRSPCETTCDNIKSRGQRNCSRPCVAGCFCRSGFVRSSDYTCVRPEDCNRPSCAENEVYLECGSSCELNCTNLNKGIFCAKPCHKGCFCKPNFVRNAKGKCVHPRNCERAGNNQCPVNEQYVNCVSFCNTCYTTPYCTTPYCSPGCDCKYGYYRNYFGECVTEEECYNYQYGLQDQCGVNEIYTSCMIDCNDCISKGSCYNEQYMCFPGCDCKHGYFRNSRGVCIPEWSCDNIQPNCPSGEQYYYCVPTCRTTCETYNEPNFVCNTTCTSGCHCTPGRVRRQDGVCVLPKDCPVRRCPPGEAYYHCKPTCGTTCRSLTSLSGVCPTKCESGCFCQPGSVRNDQGRCVRAENCPVPATRRPPTRRPPTRVPPTRRPPTRVPATRRPPTRVPPTRRPPTRVPATRRPPTRVPPTCPPGEVFYDCVPCNIACTDLNSSCTQDCSPGCACERGFVRGPDGRCIRPSNCPIASTTVSNGVQGRRGGTDEDDLQNESTSTPIASTITNEDSRKNESTTISSTETTSTLKSETETDISDVSVSDSTERTTTIAKVTDVTTVSKSESDNTSPQSTEQATPLKPSQTSPANDATEKTTSFVTSAVETSKTKVTDSGAEITTVQVATSTVSENATSVNSTAEP